MIRIITLLDVIEINLLAGAWNQKTILLCMKYKDVRF